MGFPSRASEFPNDNSEISDGAIWICPELTGPATVELAPYEPLESEPFVLMFDDDDAFVDEPIALEITSGTLSLTVALPAPEPEPNLNLNLSSDPDPS